MTVGPLRTSEASSSYLLGESLWKWDKEYGGGTESEGPVWVRMVLRLRCVKKAVMGIKKQGCLEEEKTAQRLVEIRKEGGLL